MEALAEIDHLAGSDWMRSRTSAAQQYRLHAGSTVAKALDLLRGMYPLAAYVGGERAEAMKTSFERAAEDAVTYRDGPTEETMRTMIGSTVNAIRAAFDLVMLGSAVDAAAKRAAEVTTEAQQSMEAVVSSLRQETSEATARIRAEADLLLDEVSARGNEAVARTRKAVAGTLLNDAQEQFANAQRWFNWQVAIWVLLATGSAAAFVWTSSIFLVARDLPPDWHLAFYGGMRLVLLGGLAAIASFCFRMLKHQIGFAQLNAHRTRVARSMPGLLEVAPETERLVVLQSLIQTIVGTRESVVSDASAESFLVTSEIIEKIVKASKTGTS